MFQTIPEWWLGFHIQKRDGINNSITDEQVFVDFVSTKGFDLKTLSPSLMDWNFWAVWPPNPTDMGCDHFLRQGTPTNAGHVIVFVRMSSILLISGLSILSKSIFNALRARSVIYYSAIQLVQVLFLRCYFFLSVYLIPYPAFSWWLICLGGEKKRITLFLVLTVM